MKTTLTALLIAGLTALARSQASFVNGGFQCAIPGGTYCAEDSMTSNIIIRCTNGMGQPGNCDDDLANQSPTGPSQSLCYESSNTAGDAACSKDGTVFPDSGASYPVPSSSSSSSSPAPTYSSTAVVTYTMSTQTFTDTTDYSSTTPGPGGPSGTAGGASGTSGGGSSSATTTTFYTPTPTSGGDIGAHTGGASQMDVEALSAFAGFGVLAIAAALL